jgi:hypothetical protein
MWFWIGLIIWLLIGFASVSLIVYNELRKGENVTLGEALISFGVALMGPVALIISIAMLVEEHKNMVLIHGMKKEE